jgi:hypothetical protein
VPADLRTYRLTTAYFAKPTGWGFGNQPTALRIGQAALQRGQGILLLQEVRQLVGVMPEVGKVVAIAGIAHFIEQSRIFRCAVRIVSIAVSFLTRQSGK